MECPISRLKALNLFFLFLVLLNVSSETMTGRLAHGVVEAYGKPGQERPASQISVTLVQMVLLV